MYYSRKARAANKSEPSKFSSLICPSPSTNSLIITMSRAAKGFVHDETGEYSWRTH